MRTLKNFIFHKRENLNVSGSADVPLTACRRDADPAADFAADVRLPGPPQNEFFYQKGVTPRKCSKNPNLRIFE
jgi:hypothetical protein